MGKKGALPPQFKKNAAKKSSKKGGAKKLPAPNKK